MPTSASTTTHFLETNLYVSAAIGADDEVAALAKPVEAADAKLRAAKAAREAAGDEVVRSEARCDFALSLVGRQVKSFDRKVEAHFDGKGKEYQKIYANPPTWFLQAPDKERVKRFTPLLEAASDAGLPRELAPGAKALKDAWARYEGAEEHLAAARRKLEKAEAHEQECKEECLTALRTTEGKLMTQFPDDRERVRSYFPKKPAPKKKEEKKESPPALPPAP